jgi:hypothetical protein
MRTQQPHLTFSHHLLLPLLLCQLPAAAVCFPCWQPYQQQQWQQQPQHHQLLLLPHPLPAAASAVQTRLLLQAHTLAAASAVQ